MYASSACDRISMHQTPSHFLKKIVLHTMVTVRALYLRLDEYSWSHRRGRSRHRDQPLIYGHPRFLTSLR